MKRGFRVPGLLIMLAFSLFPFCHDTAWGNTAAIDTSQLFLQANQAYKERSFKKAADYYEEITAAGIVNGQIFYNLGNAYLKSGKVGKAILNYQKAQMLIPRDEDLKKNYQYARGLTRDSIACRELLSALKNFCFWYSSLSINELVALFLIANFILWGMLTVMIFFRREILTIAVYVLIFLTMVFGVSSGVKIYNYKFNHKGIVVVQEIKVRSGNSIHDTVLFKLHEGTEFSWLQESGGWVKIRLCDQKKGWVQKEVVEKVEL